MPAGKAGDDHAAAMDPDPGIRPRDQIGTAPTAEPAFQWTFYPYPVTHPYLSGQFHAPVAPGRVFRVELGSPRKKDSDPLASKPSGAGFSFNICHGAIRSIEWWLLRLEAQGYIRG